MSDVASTASPFVWHIYPQADGAHWPKLDAFIDRIKKERESKALPADFSQHEPTAGDAIA